jgi:rhodanese-related sulfurtransferase
MRIPSNSSFDRTSSSVHPPPSTRAFTVAASLLSQAGFEHVDVFLGSLAAWQQRGFDTENTTG